ncbi:hypothetical protein D9M71_742550 [compost metagenome]
MRGRKRAFCSSVPNLMITGATIFTPKASTRGAPAANSSSSKMCFCTALQPVPPCSTGQPGASQPRLFRMRIQKTQSSLLSRLPWRMREEM